MTYSEDYRKRHYNSEHTVKNGRLQNNGLMLGSGQEDTIINQNNYGVLNTTFDFGVKLDQNFSVQLLSYKSVDLDALFFSKGLSSDGKEVINSKGDNAKVVQRLCAEGDGATGEIVVSGIKTLGTKDYDLTCYMETSDISQRGWFAGNPYFGNDVRCGLYMASSAVAAIFHSNTNSADQVNITLSFATLGITNNSVHKYRVWADRDDKLHFYVDDVEVGIAQDISTFSAVNMTFKEDFTLFADQTNNIDAKIWDVKLKHDSDVIVDMSLEGSTYDTSGNDNHGTIVGDVDLTATTINTDGIYSLNLNNGFDLYYDDATGLIAKYVPYRNGVPVVASVAGYTLDSRRPAGKGFNQAPVKVVIGSSGHDGTGYVAEAWLVNIDTDENFYTAGATNYCKELSYDDLVAITSDYVVFNIDDDGQLLNLALYDPAGFAEDSFNVSVAGDLLNIYCKSDIHSVVLDDFMADMNVTLVFDFDTYELKVYIDGLIKGTFTLDPSFTLTSSDNLKLGSTNTDFNGKQLIKYLEIRDGALSDTEVSQLTAELESLKFPSKPYGKMNKQEIRNVFQGDGTTAWINCGVTGAIPVDGCNKLEVQARLVTMSTIGASVISCYSTSSNKRGWQFWYYPSTNLISGYLGKVDGTLLGNYGILYTLKANDLIRVVLTGNVVTNSIDVELFVNGKLTGTDSVAGQSKIYENGGTTDIASYQGAVGGHMYDGRLANIKQWVDGALKLDLPLNNDTTDYSGEGNNGVVNGAVTFPMTTIPIETNPIFHKSDWGVLANETAITSGLIENTPYEVLTGSFKVVMDTYNGHDVKVLECVTTGTVQLPETNAGTDWGCYTDTGSGYAYEEGPASITADVLSMTAGDKVILGDIRGEYAIRRI